MFLSVSNVPLHTTNAYSNNKAKLLVLPTLKHFFIKQPYTVVKYWLADPPLIYLNILF